MNFYKIIKLAFVAVILSVSAAQASTSVGVIASVSSSKQKDISFAIDSRAATNNLISQKNNPKSQHIYWLERKACDSYHATLDLIAKANGGNFNGADYAHLESVLNNFKVHAQALNQPKNTVKGKKAYRGNGYELRLFVHYTDGTHKQFNASNINDVLMSTKDISYANIVLKLGTHGGLKKDWKFVQKTILTNPKHAAYTRQSSHDLETHITIANLFKYTKQQNHIVGNSVQRKNGKSPWNVPFDHTKKFEMQMLVDTFNLVNRGTDFSKLKGINIDRLQITGKQNGSIVPVKTVKF